MALGAIVALVVIGGFVAVRLSSSDATHPIEEAATSCDAEGNVGDDGSSISFDTAGTDDLSGDSYEDMVCVLQALEVPDHVISKLTSTRALDGTLDASWDGFEASWNYHPDSGMNLTIYEAD